MQQRLVIQLVIVDACEVRDGAPDDHCYQTADNGVVHVGYGVELSQRIPETKLEIFVSNAAYFNWTELIRL